MKLVIEGVPPWDGEYDVLDDFGYTGQEYHRIKEVCGVTAGNFVEQLGEGDAGAYVALADCVLARQGHKADIDDLWKAPVGQIRFKTDETVPPTTSVEEGAPNVTESSSGGDFVAAGV